MSGKTVQLKKTSEEIVRIDKMASSFPYITITFKKLAGIPLNLR